MIRFFAPPENIYDNTIILSAQDTEKLRSLKPRSGETIIVCDGNCTDYVCRLVQMQTGDSAQNEATAGADEEQMVVQILSRQRSLTEPSIECTVYIAHMEDARLDYAVQKSVELGAFKIVLYNCVRSAESPKNMHKKTERLQEIAFQTARLSNRGIVPKISAVDEYQYMAETAAANNDLAMLFFEKEENLDTMTVLSHFFPLYNHDHFNKELDKVRTVAVITGPVEGFDPAEVKFAQSKGISVVSLGSRLLRAETAPVVALSAIMYHTRNL